MKARHQQFADAFLTVANGNATKAALAIGCSETSASVLGSRMLKRPDVQAYLQRKAQKADLTSQKALERVAAIASATPQRITASDVINANALILKVNGALKDKGGDSRITVNIGFLTQQGSPQPAVSVMTGSETVEGQVMSQVMATQPQVSRSE